MTQKKPVIVYVDDETNNIATFEDTVPEDWEVHSFDSPLAALEKITDLHPWVVATDQRMPGMVGVKFLEIIKKTHPDAKRVLVTGFSEENLVIDSIRQAGIHDYIRKPWEPEDLVHRMTQMVETYLLEADLRMKTQALQNQFTELRNIMSELQTSKSQEETLRKELESWAPPFLLNLIGRKDLQFPVYKDIALIAFDVIGSSEFHGMTLADGSTVTKSVLRLFEESVISQGGCLEYSGGDAGYAHFGFVKDLDNPADAALAASSEFRTKLRNFSTQSKVAVECGVALHFAEKCRVDLTKSVIRFKSQDIYRKSFNTTSADIDLLHRMEKLVHELPGSNVIMSDLFLAKVTSQPPGLADLGGVLFKGAKKELRVSLKQSDRVQLQDLEKLYHVIRGLNESQFKAA